MTSMRGVPGTLLSVVMLAAAVSNGGAQPAGTPRIIERDATSTTGRTQTDAPAAPITFEENRGVADRRVQFFSRGKDYSLLLKSDGAGLGRAGREALRLHVDRSNSQSSVSGLVRMPGTIYYARGSQLIGSATYRRVRYADIYKGIDLEYYGKDRQLEFDFLVRPHADPRQIRLSFADAQRITLGDEGDLHSGWLTMT